MSVSRMRAAPVQQIAAVAITAGFAAWAALRLAGVTWHILAPDIPLSAAAPLANADYVLRNDKEPESVTDLERLQSVFVLRNPGANAGPAEDSMTGVQAADTRLALALKGAVASSDPSSSRAIIASAGTQQIYRPGDSIQHAPGTVVLQQIFATYVLLDNNGRTETLRMDEVAAPRNQTTDGTSAIAISETSVDAPHTLPEGINAGTALTDLVRIQPLFEPADSARAGELRGLQIRHGSRQDFLSAVGLRQGDLITGVDGRALDASVNLPELMSQLSTKPSVALQILRDQTVLTVHLDRSRW